MSIARFNRGAGAGNYGTLITGGREGGGGGFQLTVFWFVNYTTVFSHYVGV